MRNWFSRLFPAKRTIVPNNRPRAESFRTLSRPEGWKNPNLRENGEFLPLPDNTPFAMLPTYRFLRDAIPDISDAVWTWKQLCQTGYDVEIEEASSPEAKRRALRILRNLDQRVNSGDRGMDGLLDIFYTSLFTFGAAALEMVPAPGGGSLADVVPVDVWTVRFRRKQGRVQACQVIDGEVIPLPDSRFLYVGLDRDGTNPYGRSMLRCIPFVIKIQQRLLEDMARATHNAGWSRLHVRYEPGPRARGESDEAYRARVENDFFSLREQLDGLDPEQNLVTYDNVRIELLHGGQRATVFYENHKAIEEQVITAMHLMPILLGRNYGTTETYGTAQFEIINRQVKAVNRGVRRILERLYNFELSLMWGSARARVHMRDNHTVDVLKNASARAREIENVLALYREKFLSHAEAAARLGLPSAP